MKVSTAITLMLFLLSILVMANPSKEALVEASLDRVVQPEDQPWPQYQGDYSNTGRSRYDITNNTGEIKWKLSIGGNDNRNSVVIGRDDIMYFGTWNNGTIYSIYPNGSVQWKYYTGNRVFGIALDNYNNLYFGSSNYFYCLNKSGILKWKYLTGGIISSFVKISKNGNILFGSDDCYLYCLNPNGTLSWKYKNNDAYGNFIAIDHEGHIFIPSSYDVRKLTCLYDNGSVKWEKDMNTALAGPCIDDNGNIIVPSFNLGYIYALFPNGSIKWSYKTVVSTYISGSCSINEKGCIYFGDEFGYLYAINPNGTEKWKVKVNGSFSGSPTIDSKGNIVITSDNNYVYSFNNRGELLFSTETGNKFFFNNPGIDSNNNIYVINSNELLCLATSFPSNPLNVSLKSGNKFNNISWDPPNISVKAPIIKYRVYRNSTMDNWTMIKEVTIANSYYNDTGIENGIEYHYYVVACNMGGEGDPSDIVKGRPSGRPGPPIDLQFVQTKGNINITWDPPLDTGGLEIMYYNVYRIENENESDPRVKISFDEEYLDTFVLPYFNYTYWITAVNPKGEGPPSEQIVVKTSMPTSKPIDLKARAGNGFAEISWEIPERLNDGGEILHYMVYRNGSFISDAGLDRIFNDTGLTNAVTYRYSVSAFTLIGEGDISDEIEVRPFTIPGKPRNLTSSSIGDNVTLLWEQPLSDGGSIITKYIVEKVEMGVQTFYSESPVNTYTDSHVMRGRNLTYRVAGVNAAGQGPFSDPLSVFIDPGGIPKEPRNLKAVLTNDGIRLTWEEPSDIIEPILIYKIFRIAEGVSQYSFLRETKDESYLDRDISPNTTYRYRVTASSRSGEGPYSEEVRITIGSDYVPAQGPGDDKLVVKIILAVVGTILLIIIIGLIIVVRKPAPKVNVPKDNEVFPITMDESSPPLKEDTPINEDTQPSVVPPEENSDPSEPPTDPGEERSEKPADAPSLAIEGI